MKLLRVGTPGKERPALLDAAGVLGIFFGRHRHRRGRVVPGFARQDRQDRRGWTAGGRRIAADRAVRRARRQVPLHRPELLRSRGRVEHGRAEGAHRLLEGDLGIIGPYDDVECRGGRRRATGRSSSASSSASPPRRDRSRRAVARRRLLRRQRSLGARLSSSKAPASG